MTKMRMTSQDKFIVRLARDKGFWPCKACSDDRHNQWHQAEETSCPYTGLSREEAEDMSEDLK